MEDIVEQMRDEVDIVPIRGDAFTVSFTSEDPRTAFRVTERLATLFIDESLKDREVLAQGTNQFLESTLEEARRALIDNEKKREEYRRKFDGQLPDQTSANLQALNNANMQLQILFDSQNRDRDRQAALERTLEDLQNADTFMPPPPPPVAAPGTKTAADELRQLQEELSIAKLRLTPDHPDITRLQQRVGVAQERADEEAAATAVSPNGRNPAEVLRENRIRDLKLQRESIEKALKENEARQAKLRDQMAVYQKRLEGAPTRESELVDLMRDYGVLQANYTSTLEKYQDSRIAANLERRQIGEQFKTIEPARLPQRPFSPNRPYYYAIGVLAGIAAGLGLAGLLEYFDRTMRSEDDVRVALSLPVLAAIPLVVNPAAERRRRLIALSASAAVLLVVGAAAAAWKFLR
jgi:polysaccharide chain length determinant protein (PEP-CTERM system associated)